MMDLWSLPTKAEFGSKDYELSTDFRDILDIIDVLKDESIPKPVRWEIASRLFFGEKIPIAFQKEAIGFFTEFLSYGEQPDSQKKQKKLIDWTFDAAIIIGDVNKVAGFDVRAVPYVHWWTFLAYFNGIGEGQLSTVVGIRSKLQKGKPLEKWEQEFYLEHKDQIEFRAPQEANEAREYFDKWL